MKKLECRPVKNKIKSTVFSSLVFLKLKFWSKDEREEIRRKREREKERERGYKGVAGHTRKNKFIWETKESGKFFSRNICKFF